MHNSKYTATSTSTTEIDEGLVTSCQHYFEQKISFKPASQPDRYLERINSRYRPLNPVMPEEHANASDSPTNLGKGETLKVSKDDGEKVADGIPSPKRILYDPAELEMRWLSPRGVGSGLGNMGNTCFLNSVLQCLTYTPPLVNYLASNHHEKSSSNLVIIHGRSENGWKLRLCRGQGFCAMCELQSHVQKVMNHQSGGVVRPMSIVQNLRVIGKHFRQGRQEDAHEFLRYFVDGLQRSSLQGVAAKLDPHSKATTVIHQVFGGYHCSQVSCTKCQKTSETFDPLLDLSLDIKNCSTLVQALNRFTKPDSLEGDNQYACPHCKEMTPALKRFTLHRLPNILTIQLKRFDYNSLFGGKINKMVSYPLYLDMCPYTTSKKGPPQWYRLYSVLVHSGYSCRSGHYYCYSMSPNKVWHCLNDSQVYQVSANQVLQQEAYLLFYARDLEYKPPTTTAPSKPLTPSNSSQARVRPDPNFLGQPIKRPPGVDKSGTPLVKLKPTGIVPPSPQESGRGTAVPQPSNTLPLRKSDVDKTPLPPAPVVASPPKPANVPIKKPSFLPRVIATPSSKKKKIQVVKSVDKVQETGENRDRDGQMTCGDTTPNTSEKRDEDSLGQTSEAFIGPLLPQDTPSSHPAALPTPQVATTSPKIARVQPQVKPSKPVALVHPVVSSTPSVRKLIRKGGLVFNRTPQPQNDKPQWKPVGAPDPVSSTSAPTTPSVDPVEKESETPSRTGEVELTQETRKRKKHKKKKDHRRGEWDEREDSERGRERHKQEVEKGKKRHVHSYESSEEEWKARKKLKTQEVEKGKKRRAHSYESSEEEWKVRKKLKTHESRKEKKKSRRLSTHRRERSHSSASYESSDSRQHYRREHHRDKKYEVGKTRESGHRDREHREGRRHEAKRQRHQSSSSSQSLHKSRHHTPTPDRSKRKRYWSSDSDDESHRHKSDRRHSQKKYRSSEHRHKHHDKIQKSKHLSSVSELGSKTHSHHRHKHRHDEGKWDSDVSRTPVQEAHAHKNGESAHGVPNNDERESIRTEQKSASVEKTGKRSGSDIPEVEWDSSLKAEGKGGKGSLERGKWDGSLNHAVVEALTSHAPNQLGTKVKSWDGGDNSIDNTTLPDEWKRKRKQTDTWNQELDKGKVKSVKIHEEREFPLKNPFQEFQNNRNTK